MATIDTGLGWNADSDYLVYEKDQLLADLAIGLARKLNEGYSIALWMTNRRVQAGTSTTYGLLLISTNYEYIKIYIPNYDIYQDHPSFVYQNKTFYWAAPYNNQPSTNTRIPSYNANNKRFTDIIDEVMATAKVTVTIPDTIDISTCSVQLSPTTFVYDGTTKEPIITVTRLDTSTTPPTVITLVKDTDYTVTYENNINPSSPTEQGNAKAIITGIGNYSGTRTEEFTIVTASHDISLATATLDNYYFTYTGDYIRPVPKVVMQGTLSSTELNYGTDFALNYANNVTIGTATIIITGIGDYAGTKTLSFYITKSDPFTPGGTSGEGGGDGDDDYSSSTVAPSGLPTISAADTGLTRIYVPDITQVRNLANYLWREDSTWQTIVNHIKQYFDDVMGAIIGFNLIPVSRDAIGYTGPENVRILIFDTGVAMYKAANQYVRVDCGTCEVTTQIGSFLDYAPYTQIELFLPYIGSVKLNTDEVMGKTLHVIYNIDIVTGSCVAEVLVDDNVFYQFSGQCAIAVPMTQANYSQYIAAAIGVAGTAAGALIGGIAGKALGGLGQALSSQAVTQTSGVEVTNTTTTMTQGINPNTNRLRITGRTTTTDTQLTEPSSSIRTYTPSIASRASFLGLSPGSLANAVGEVVSSKPSVQHSGSFSGNSGYLGTRKCFLTITRPKQALPSGYNQVNGYPCMMWLKLGNLSGFTKVQQMQLVGIPATNPELDELMLMLKEGVVL